MNWARNLITIYLLITKFNLIVCLTKCLENEFRCPLTGDCIDKLMVCDGFIDCPGYHDEFNCSSLSMINSRSLGIINCPGFLCKDSDECLNVTQVCDGVADCPKGGDELNCPVVDLVCLTDCGFDSDRNQTITRCLNRTSICDGIKDCYNDADEINCDQPIQEKRSKNQPNYINCNASNSFNCGNGKCIVANLVCDGKPDCPNGFDESISCNLNATCDTRSCTQKCVPLINGSKCDCHKGYQLLADGYTCEDIDECSTGPFDYPCFHRCVNTLGSYRCECFEGHTLRSDGKSCDKQDLKWKKRCKVNTKDPYLLMVKNSAVSFAHFNCISNGSPLIWANLTTQISTFTYDKMAWKIYYYAVTQSAIYVIDVPCKNSTRFIKLEGVTRAIKSMVFDDLTGNLYWIEPAKGLVQIVSTLEPNRTVITLIDGLTDAHQIVLNQERSEMYISILGFEPKILVASLNGKNIREIDTIGNTLIQPSALFLDKTRIASNDIEDESQRLYWSDSGTLYINYVSLSPRKGEFGPKQVIYKFDKTVRSMIVHDEKFYLATNEDKLIEVEIFRNFREPNGERRNITVPNGFASTSNNLDLFYGFDFHYRSPCLDDDRGGCSHICTFIDSVVTCLCPKGMALDLNGKTCIDRRTVCRPDELICDDGSDCFKKSAQCDGHFDCADKSDETDCTSMRSDCPKDKEHCPNTTKCIPKNWFCDSFYDCPEGLDEANCHKTCGPNEFNCGGDANQCIPSDWVCDEIVDCINKSDESICPKAQI